MKRKIYDIIHIERTQYKRFRSLKKKMTVEAFIKYLLDREEGLTQNIPLHK